MQDLGLPAPLAAGAVLPGGLRPGRAIRPISALFLMLSGALAALSGIMVSSLAVPRLTGTRTVLMQRTVFFLWAALASQWNPVPGVAGIFSLAQRAFFAVGACGTAMLAAHFGVAGRAAFAFPMRLFLLAMIVVVGLSGGH